MKKIALDLLYRFFNLALTVLIVVGAVLLFEFLAPRSEVETQFLFGLSFRRLILGGAFVFCWMFNLSVLVLRLWCPVSVQSRVESKVQRWVPWGLTLLYLTALISITIWVAMLPPILGLFKFLRSMRDQLNTLFLWLFLLCLVLIVYLRIHHADLIREMKAIAFMERFIVAAVLFVAVFFLYAHFAALIGWVNKGKYAFWDLLAEQILQGRLYIPNPPYTHDLTLYEGRWYVPMPPLPAFLMLPFVYLYGAENIDASYFSIALSALNGVVLFFIFKELNKKNWISLSQSGMVTLVVLFLFGTPHLWVGISGRGWYVSQILTVLLLLLAVYCVLKSGSAFWTGTFIGLAIMARPNSLLTWPFVFAIAMQLLREKKTEVKFRDIFIWSVKTFVPITLAIVALLLYNYLRFDNFFDFGYATINGDPTILKNIQTWGMFSIHFIPRNLQAMFLELPWLTFNRQWPIEPSTAGMSIFLTTPALIYLFRRYPQDWWIIGSWCTIFFNILLLSMYHNTGAHQFGYRYILDFQIPLFIMLAVGIKEKIPWYFYFLVLLSVTINLYGANWFMNA